MDELCRQLERTVVVRENGGDNIRANLQQLFGLYRVVDPTILFATICNELHYNTVETFKKMIIGYLVFKKRAEGTVEVPSDDSCFTRVYDEYVKGTEPKLEVYFDVSKSSVDLESLNLNRIDFDEFDHQRQIAFYCRGDGYLFSLVVSVM